MDRRDEIIPSVTDPTSGALVRVEAERRSIIERNAAPKVYRFDFEVNRGPIAVSRDGRWAALVSGMSSFGTAYGREVGLVDLELGRRVRTLREPGVIFYCAAFSPTGDRLALGEDDSGRVRLYAVPSGRPLGVVARHPVVPHPLGPGLYSVAWSPDGRYLASGSLHGEARIHEASTGELVALLARHDGWVRALQFSEDGSRLLTCEDDGRTARVWDWLDDKALGTMSGAHWRVVALRADGQRVLGRLWRDKDEGPEVVVAEWDARGARLWEAELPEPVERVAYTRRGEPMVETERGRYRLEAGGSGRARRVALGRARPLAALASHDLRWKKEELPGIVWVEPPNVFVGSDGFAAGHLLVQSRGAPASVFDLETAARVHLLEPDGEGRAAKGFIGGPHQYVVKPWHTGPGPWAPDAIVDLASRATLQELPGEFVGRHPHDGLLFLVKKAGERETLIIWDRERRRSSSELRCHDEQITSCHVRGDTLVVAAHRDVKLIALSTGQKLRVIKTSFAAQVCLSPDGRRVFFESRRGSFAVEEVATGRRLVQFPDWTGHVSSVAWSPREDRIAVLRTRNGDRPGAKYQDYLAEEYDAETGARLHRAWARCSHLGSVTYSPDGALRVVSGGELARFYGREGELAATLRVMGRDFLWTTPPDELGPGWHYTNRPELLTVVEEVGEEPPRALPTDDPRRLEQVHCRSSAKAVAARLAGRQRYREFMARRQLPPALPAPSLRCLPSRTAP